MLNPDLKQPTGFSLLEISMAMMIVAVLSIGVSNLIRSGIETQMAESMHQHMQVVGTTIVDDLRHDLREADSASIINGGNTLRLQAVTGPITYRLASNGDFSRTTPSGSSKIYNHNGPVMPGPNNQPTYMLKIACPGSVSPTGANLTGCFAPGSLNSSGEPRQVMMPNLQVQQKVSSNTLIDKNFGAPNYTVRDFSFTLASAIEFY